MAGPRRRRIMIMLVLVVAFLVASCGGGSTRDLSTAGARSGTPAHLGSVGPDTAGAEGAVVEETGAEGVGGEEAVIERPGVETAGAEGAVVEEKGGEEAVVERLFIGPTRVACSGYEGQRECLDVARAVDGRSGPLYLGILGFEYRPGHRYVIDVVLVDNPEYGPFVEDVDPKIYELVDIVEMVPVETTTGDAGPSSPEAVPEIADEVMIERWWIGPDLANCEASTLQTWCLQIATGPGGDYRIFSDGIAGFVHQPGIVSVIDVAITPRPDEELLADVGAYVYTLVDIVEETAVMP